MPRPPTHPTRPTTRRTPRGEPYPARRPASSRYTLVCHPPNCPCPNHRRRVSNDRQVDNQQQPPVNDASPPSANRRASPPVLPSVEPLAFGYRSLSLSVPSLEEASEPEDDLDLARPTLSTCGSCSASVSSDEDLPTPVHESRRPASSSNGRSLYERSRSSRALFAADQYALSLRRGNPSLPASGYISFDSPPPDTLFAESVRDFIASGFRDWPDFGFHNKMLIKVRTLTGKEIELDIDRDFKVSKIKERVEEKEGIPPVQQRLIYGGKQMADEKTAEDYNLEGGATLHLVLALRGGGLA